MNKFKLFSLLATFCALSTSAFAATHGGGSSDIQWGVQGPFELINGNAYWGAYVSGDYPLMNDITIGGESGFLIGSSNGISIFDIPIAVTGKYHLNMSSMPNWRPYVGAALGLSVLHTGGGTVTVGNVTGTAASDTSAKFRFEAKVGTAFQPGPGLMSEIRLGVVDGNFLFAPSIGYNF
jgi:hypothetical protein